MADDFTAAGSATGAGAAALTADTAGRGALITGGAAQMALSAQAAGTATDAGRGLVAAGLNAVGGVTAPSQAALRAYVAAGSGTVCSGYAVLAPLLDGRRVPWVPDVPPVPVRTADLFERRIGIGPLPRASTGESGPARRTKGTA